jgi:hypothetical protein
MTEPVWPQEPGRPQPIYPDMGYGQYQPASPPGQQPFFVQPRPRTGKRSRWLAIGLPVGLVLVVGGVALAVAGVHSVGEASGAVDRFGAAIRDGRFSDAHGMLCAADRTNVSTEQMAQHYGTGPRVTAYEVADVNVANVNGHSSASAVLVLKTEDGLSNQINLQLVREDGAWRPCP